MKLLAALPALLAVVACKNASTPKDDPMPTTPRKPAAMPAAADVAPLATANNTFAFELWTKAAPAGNAAISPASITTALAMTWGGAKGTTSDEMKAVLHLAGDPATVMATWGALSSALQDPKRPLTLRIANRLFGQTGYKFEQPFVDATRDAYGAPLEPTDFEKAPEHAREHINQWVEAQTEKRIKDLLPPKSIKTETRLVLVNAIYFLADWASQFEKRATHDEPFHAAGGDHTVPMMYQRGMFRLARTGGAAVLELPYQGGSASMLVILPDKTDGLAAIEQSLDATTFAKWRGALASTDVEVYLPKFTIDPAESLELSTALRALGMPDAFEPTTADFTGIATPPDPNKRLFISAVFHKAFVKTDEKGTEAAAATAVVMDEGTGAPPPPGERFHADHPFLFVIVDQETGLILFMGRVADPQT